MQDGQDTPIGGTSAAAPVLSGMVSLINDALLNAGKPPLGVLNYFLCRDQIPRPAATSKPRTPYPTSRTRAQPPYRVDRRSTASRPVLGGLGLCKVVLF